MASYKENDKGGFKKKDPFHVLPVENHKTAAWIRSTKQVKQDSQVVFPHIQDVELAKEWVDSNEL